MNIRKEYTKVCLFLCILGMCFHAHPILAQSVIPVPLKMEQGTGCFLLSENTKLYINLQGLEAQLLENCREELHFSSFLLPENMELLDTLFAETEHPLGVLLERELEDELNRSIEELPAECRMVFKKSRFEQKKYEEIASELGISVNTVKYHIKQALAFLQKRLGNYLKLLLVYLLAGN